MSVNSQYIDDTEFVQIIENLSISGRKEVKNMKEIKLEIEELEERIAPSFAFAGSSPAEGAGQGGPQGDFDTSFGPNSTDFPSQNPAGTARTGAGNAAWAAHDNSPLVNGGNN
jgi:hypothetical protein